MATISRCVLICLFICLVHSLSAIGFGVGIMGGANAAINTFQLAGPVKAFDAKLGYNGNLFGRLILGKLVIQPEIGYYYNRVGFNVQEPSKIQEVTFNLGKIYSSPLLGFKLAKLRLMAGPVIYTSAFENFSTATSSVSSLKSSVNNDMFSFGGQLGLGIDITKKWAIDMRFQKMFTNDTYIVDVSGTSNNIQGSLGTASVSLGYAIFAK